MSSKNNKTNKNNSLSNSGNFNKLVFLSILVFAGLLLLFTGVSFTQHKAIKKVQQQLLVQNNAQPQLTQLVAANPQSVRPNVPTEAKVTSVKGKKVYTLSPDPARVIKLFGEIGTNALDVASRITEMSSADETPIYLILTGPGGSVVTGAAIIAAIQNSKAPVVTVCDVMCASMDSMIHQYGAQRFMTDRSIIMFHPATANTEGDIDRMNSFVSFLKSYTEKMETDVSSRWHISLDDYKVRAAKNVWVDAEDAVNQNIADGIVVLKLTPTSGILLPGQEKQSHITFDKVFDFKWIN